MWAANTQRLHADLLIYKPTLAFQANTSGYHSVESMHDYVWDQEVKVWLVSMAPIMALAGECCQGHVFNIRGLRGTFGF